MSYDGGGNGYGCGDGSGNGNGYGDGYGCIKEPFTVEHLLILAAKGETK